MKKYLLISALLFLAFNMISAQQGNHRVKFPDKFYLETQIMVGQTSSVLQVCNLQEGATYSVYMYDERAKEDRVCEYKYGQDYRSTDEFVNVKADGKCLDIDIDRFDCKFESSVLVTVIMHCLDCTAARPLDRDPTTLDECDLKLAENNDYEYLISEVLLAKTCFEVDVASIQSRGVVGEFWQGHYAFGMEEGIAMANAPLGSYQSVGGGNAYTSTGTQLGTAGDLDLTQLLTYATWDASVLEFDFYPTDNFVEFEYVFASEEYCEWVNSPFNDGFALLLSGPGIRGDDYGQPSLRNNAINLAVLPDLSGNLDYTTNVAIRTIHWDHYLYGHIGQVGNFYVSNNFLCNDCGVWDPNNPPRDITGGHNSIGTCSPSEMYQSPLPSVPPAAPTECAYDAWTTVLTARFDDLIPCEKYHIKFVMADGTDRIWGSGIFLRGSSFSAGGASAGYDINFGNGQKYMYERCGDQTATLVITRNDNDQTAGFDIEYGFEIGGTAINGTDYTTDIGSTMIIPPLPPPGEFYRFINVIPDDIEEAVETITITIDNPCSCEPEIVELEIIDLPPLEMLPLNDDTTCFATLQGLVAFVEGGFPDVDRDRPTSGYTYSWSSDYENDTYDTRNILFTPPDEPGTYTYYVEVSDDCGQMLFDTAHIVVTGFPEAQLTGDVFICETVPEAEIGLSLQGAGPWDLVYAIDGVEQAPITITDPDFALTVGDVGEYSLVSVYSGGCSGPVTGLATVGEINIDIQISPDETSCIDAEDGELTAIATGGNGTTSYVWEDGQMNQTATGLAPGMWTVVVTDELGCTEELAGEVVAADAVVAAAAMISGTTCADPQSGEAQATGTGGSGTFTYEWFDSGDTSVSDQQSPDDLEAGTYTIIVTDSNGCEAETTVEISADVNTPDAEAAVSTVLSCETLSLLLDGAGSSTGGDFEYTWTSTNGNIVSGSDGLNPEVDMPGTYDLLVTNTLNGCTNSTSIVVDQDVDSPVADAGPIQQLDCDVNTVSLGGTTISTGPEFSYQWSTSDGNILSGETSANPDVDAGGTYQVLVTNTTNGCTAMADVVIPQDENLPTIAVQNPAILTCANPDQTLDASGSSTGSEFTYEWTTTTGNIMSGGSDLNPQINAPGTYTLIITNTDNNCTAEQSFVVDEDAEFPDIAIAPPIVIDCNNPNITLDGSGSESGADITYTWTTPDGNIVGSSSNNSPQVDAAGTYTLVVNNSATGCSQTRSVDVIMDMQDPTADAGPQQQIDCISSTVDLGGTNMSAGPEFSYQWTTANGTIISGNTSINPTISAGGTYEVLVTNTTNGCTALETVVIDEDINDPVISDPAIEVLTCEDPSQILNAGGSSAGPDFTYQWTTPTGNIITGENGLSPEIDDPGMYTLLITNTSNGCTATNSYTVTEDADFPIATIAEPEILNCLNPTISLNGAGSDSGADITYTWTSADGNVSNGVNTNIAEVDMPGTYILTVNNAATGCSETETVVVEENVEDPIADVGITQQIDCANSMATLGGTTTSTGPEFTYQWTSSDGNFVGGSNSTNPDVDAGGTYILLVTNTTNGCTAEETVIIDESVEEPQISPVFPETLTCEDPNQILDASTSSVGSEFTYVWTTDIGNIVSGEDGLSPLVDDPGTYTLLITNTSNNCTAEESFVVVEDADFPNVAVVDPIVLDCNNQTIEIDGSASDSGADITYTWETPDGNIVRNGDSPIVEIDQPGTYTFTVNNAASGCSETETVEVLSNTTPPDVDPGAGATLSCTEETVSLDGSASSQGPDFTYEWTTNAGNITSNPNSLSATVDQAAVYTLIVTDTRNGCTNSAEVEVLADENLPNVDVLEPAILTCETQITELDGSGSDQNSDLTYTWQTSDGNITSGDNSLTPSVDQPGTYTLTIENTINGCDASLSITVLQDITSPEADAGAAAELTCETTLLSLDGDDSDLGPEFEYTWTTVDGNIVSGENGLAPEIDAPGDYLLTVVNTTNRCESTSMVTITQDVTDPAIAIVEPDPLTCSSQEVIINGNASDSGANFTSTWTDATGNTVGNINELEVTDPGMYTLTIVNDANGCESSQQIEILQNIEEPEISVLTPEVLTCAVQEVAISGMGSSQGSEFEYTWTTQNGGFTMGANDLEVMVDMPGTYELLITNTINDCTTTATLDVLQDILEPTANAGQSIEITCADPENSLDGSSSSVGPEFSYNWTGSNGGFVSSGGNSLTPIITAAGTYTLTVVNDLNGCSTESTVEVTSDDVFPLAQISDPEILNCIVLETVLNANTDITGATYSWTTSDGNILSGSDTANPLINSPGEYTVEITDEENGCVSPAFVIVTEDILAPNVDAGQTFELNCTIDEVNLLGEGSSGGNFDYVWTTTDGNIISGENQLNPLVDEAGIYTLLVVNNDNGCSEMDNVEVTLDEDVPTGFIANVLPPMCYGDPGTIIVAESDIQGGTGPFEYSLDGGQTFSDNGIFESLLPGNSYEVLILDANGCDLMEIYDVPAVDSLVVEAVDNEIEILIGEDASLNVITNWPESEIQSVTWTPSNGLSCDDCLNPISSSTTSVNYTVTVVNDNGCIDEAKISFKVDRNIDIYVPNAFSPHNLDGINDLFTVFAREGTVQSILALKMYDRWGENVFVDYDFQPNQTDRGWNGTYREEPMQPGVYVYWARILLIDGTELLLEGDVTLVN